MALRQRKANGEMTMAEMTDLLAAQRAAFMAELPVSFEVRKDRLKRAAAMLRTHADAFCDALSEDFGHRSREQSMLTDVSASVAAIHHAVRHLDRWAKRDRRSVQFPLGLLGARAWVEYQPKGVVGVISPWNFPIVLVMSPLAGIFAAGNRAMVKTSEFTPRTAALFEEVVPQYFDATELAFVSGGPDVGKAFSALPFDHLIFTGATGIGRHILHAAADNLTPVTLELGGKSPVIVGRSADLEQTTERVAIGKMMNAGQICLAPDYMLVPADQEQAVVDGLKSAATAMYPTLLSNPDYTAIINDRHHQRLTDAIEDARAKGATVEVVNPANEDFGASNARKMPLHIVRNATDDMIVMQEEIFGPVLPVRRYDNVDGAIDEVNRRDRPLGLYYFGSDETERRRVLDRTISGGVTVNDVIFHVSMEDLPFGGVGPSGMGSYHGADGFRTFSHAKAVYKQAKLDVAKLAGLKPPYGKAAMASAKRQMR
jgi:coniferyl-aldehyde dehydrogenase